MPQPSGMPTPGPGHQSPDAEASAPEGGGDGLDRALQLGLQRRPLLRAHEPLPVQRSDQQIGDEASNQQHGQNVEDRVIDLLVSLPPKVSCSMGEAAPMMPMPAETLRQS